MNVGIIGNEAAKFTPETEATARHIMRRLLAGHANVLVSGHCHLGGIDIWAEEIADELGRQKLIFPPKTRQWSTGYRPRNIEIARHSDVVHVIVVEEYPPGYSGDRRFDACYHCIKDIKAGVVPEHVKSGACWTARYAERVFHKPPGVWHVVR